MVQIDNTNYPKEDNRNQRVGYASNIAVDLYIKTLLSQMEDGNTTPINEEEVSKAIGVVNTIKSTDPKTLFTLLSALNLLNAAIKDKSFKSVLYYSYIKTNVTKVADVLLTHPEKFKGCSCYYDIEQKCFYFNVLKVVFSFHQIKESKLILNIAAKAPQIIWPGLRLQRIAPQILNYAIEYFVGNSILTNEKNVNIQPLEVKNPNLTPCPACGKLISATALFCPNCGHECKRYDEIAQGINVGDKVVVETRSSSKNGVVYLLGKTFIGLSLEDETKYRVKYSAIDAITILEHKQEEPNHIQEPLSTESEFVKMIDRIYELEQIDKNATLKTNATIEDISTRPYTAITDGGKTVQCIIPPIGLNSLVKGSPVRIYFSGSHISGQIYTSLAEITYNELYDRIIKNTSKIQSNNGVNQGVITSLFTMLAYLRHVSQTKEAKQIILKYKKDIKILVDNNSPVHNEDSDIANVSNTNTSVLQNKKTELFRTDSEIQPLKVPTVLGKIDLTQFPSKHFTSSRPPQKLKIIEEAKESDILSEDLPPMDEQECRQTEKELDTLIRQGEKEECLKRSYEVIKSNRPTSKYLRSYLDRIVNTEMALGNNENAIQMLAVLIAFSEEQQDIKPSNLKHLYISLVRLLMKQNKKSDALLALDWAEYVYPKYTNATANLRQSIESMDSTDRSDDHKGSATDTTNFPQNTVVSRMLFQDVEQYAQTITADRDEAENIKTNKSLESFNIAVATSTDETKSFEFRAQLFLDAAASFLNAGMKDVNKFVLAVAHYARMKGNSLMNKINQSVQQYPDSLPHLIAQCDSARSYFVEALGLYNDLEMKGYLQELLLRYLKIESLFSQVEGGKTPNPEWQEGTLKAKLNECMSDDNIESQKVLFRACIAIGSSSPRAFNTLAQDKDGISPLYDKLAKDTKFKQGAYELINSMEKTHVPVNSQPGVFMRKIFENRQSTIKVLRGLLDDCIEWEFSPFYITTFEEKWKKITEFKTLLTTTDRQVVGSINEVINILKPYASRQANERYRNLVSAQQILLNSKKTVIETTTYYGRTFFFHLQEKWLKAIGEQIEERDAQALPRLIISTDPSYFRYDDKGCGIIDFVVTNDGESTAQSFEVTAIVSGKKYTISHDQELPAGDRCGESIMSSDFSNLDTAYVKLILTAKYQGKELLPTETAATYEKEDEVFATDESQLPWNTSSTPKESVFKGREENLKKLINHYLSKDRSWTYILYGLTRTGKSSILDYLGKRINGQSLHEDSTKKILAFQWDFSAVSYKNTNACVLWTDLLWSRIYKKLSYETRETIDQMYEDQEFPEEQLGQRDLDIIIEALNQQGIIPLITIDEFSFITKWLKEGFVDASFISDLRNLALKGKACFVYAGTYDIKNLPSEKEFGLEGQMTNTISMHINAIEPVYADELIDACDCIKFDDKAKEYIRALSGCVPYWIQWICLDCGKYAVAHKKRYLGYNEVDHVVKVLTGEERPTEKDTWEALDEANFNNNQITPGNRAEQQVISSMCFLVRESTHIERGVSKDELDKLWDKFNVHLEKRTAMLDALKALTDKQVVRQFIDETRDVYRLNVDLFRRWWFVHHRDLSVELSL